MAERPHISVQCYGHDHDACAGRCNPPGEGCGQPCGCNCHSEGGTRVTCEDVATGEGESAVIHDDYIIITDGDCEVTHIQTYATGTHVITVKRPSGTDNG